MIRPRAVPKTTNDNHGFEGRFLPALQKVIPLADELNGPFVPKNPVTDRCVCVCVRDVMRRDLSFCLPKRAPFSANLVFSLPSSLVDAGLPLVSSWRKVGLLLLYYCSATKQDCINSGVCIYWRNKRSTSIVVPTRRNSCACLRFLADSFLFNWLDLLAFSLSGLKAEGTSCAAMAYVMADLHREGAKLGKFVVFAHHVSIPEEMTPTTTTAVPPYFSYVCAILECGSSLCAGGCFCVVCDADYPIGGSGAIVDALVRGLEKNGGALRLGTHVEQVSEVYLSAGVAAAVLCLCSG